MTSLTVLNSYTNYQYHSVPEKRYVMQHMCEACGNKFTITDHTRSPERLFKRALPWHSLTHKIDEYFVVCCPRCQAWQVANEIKMFGIFSRRAAKFGLPLVFISILLLVLMLDRFGI